MSRLQQIANQESALLRMYKHEDGTGWTGQIFNTIDGSILHEFHGASHSELQLMYSKWLYSPMQSAKLKLDDVNTDNITYENESDLDCLGEYIHD